MSVLDSINSPKDLKRLDSEKLNILCNDIREFLIKNVSECGGHFASNMGIVEITVALHKVLDTEHDKLIFDVGHQAYVHKILTGRKDQFNTLRKYGGLSGFPKPSESIHDAFVAGHASTSISVAAGMAKAAKLKNEDKTIVAVIGDGALTGGLTYEAFNDIGQSQLPIIIVLNDNGMSINKNVGAIAKSLSRLRLKPRYIRSKRRYHAIIEKIPGGVKINEVLTAAKASVKRMFLSPFFLEGLGIQYLGPADGHDINTIIHLIDTAKYMGGPVLIHLNTTKGKGYPYSEEKPENFHGVSNFDVLTGNSKNKSKNNFSKVFGESICDLASTNDKICAITAAMQSGTGLTDFAHKYPERFFDVGIAEGHAVTMSAALAKEGMIPVCAIYSTFLQRAYDMIIHDVALSNLHVVFAVDRAGITGEDGETHQGVFDVNYLCHIPNLTVLCPANYSELKSALYSAVNDFDSPVVIRFPRGSEGEYEDNKIASNYVVEIGKDLTIVAYGAMINNAKKTCDILKERNISATLIKLNKICPIELSEIIQSVNSTGNLVVLEDCMSEGCVGQRVVSKLMEMGINNFKIKLFNVKDKFVKHGTVTELHKYLGLDSENVANEIYDMVKKQ